MALISKRTTKIQRRRGLSTLSLPKYVPYEFPSIINPTPNSTPSCKHGITTASSSDELNTENKIVSSNRAFERFTWNRRQTSTTLALSRSRRAVVPPLESPNHSPRLLSTVNSPRGHCRTDVTRAERRARGEKASVGAFTRIQIDPFCWCCDASGAAASVSSVSRPPKNRPGHGYKGVCRVLWKQSAGCRGTRI